ncbi:MAG: dienelactone hydrolase family protein [Usitatibacteraceae bacterium]
MCSLVRGMFGLIACMALSCSAFALDVVSDFSKAPGNGAYSFASVTPKAFPDLLKTSLTGEPINITGHLFLPASATEKDKSPAIILVHGSGGIYEAMLDYWPKQFNGAGYAVFALDTFGPRGVKSTAEEQSAVPFAADVADAFSALKLLASHPRIDASRIAIMGFSRGGIATWRAAVERVIAAQSAAQNLPAGLRFAAHIPVYSGGCVGIFRMIVKPGVFSKSPMLWVHGDADDYAAMGPCRDYAEKINQAGTPAEFFTIAGARHKFDMDEQRRIDVRNAQKTLESCPVEFDIETLYSYDRTTGQRLTGAAYVDTLKNKCAATGATIEGDRKARDKAAQVILPFLRKTFGR